MIGNDIVDIAQARNESNWQRPRFLEKLFTPQEQSLIYDSENKTQIIWRLWSMKEAAYKLHTQLYPSRFYAPKRFCCFIENDEGVVRFNDTEYYTTTKITSDYIYSEAYLSASKLVSDIIQFENKPNETNSNVLKQQLLHKLAITFNLSFKDLKLQKNNFSIPFILIHDCKIHISLSHHGNFGAYAFTA